MNENALLDEILNYHLLIHTNKRNKNLILKFDDIVKHFEPTAEKWKIEYLKDILFNDGFLEHAKFGDGDKPCAINFRGIKAAETHYYYPAAKPQGVQIARSSSLNEDEKYQAAEELIEDVVKCMPKYREFQVLEICRQCAFLNQLQKDLILDVYIQITELLVQQNFAVYSRDKNVSMYHLKNTGQSINLNPVVKVKDKLFISHSSKDEPLITKFLDTILDNALGFERSKIFYSSLEGMGVKSGEDFKEKIKEELLQSKIVLQFLSADYKKSEVCLNEMGAAWVLCDNVIPFVFSEKFDIGFIHAYNHQVKLTSKQSLLQFVHDSSNFFPNKAPMPEIVRQVEDFIKSTI